MNFTPPTPPAPSSKQYLHTMIAGALLPFAQSTIIALVIGVGTWIIAGLIFDIQDPHKSAIFFAAITWVYMMIKLQMHWLTLTAVENIVQRDINRDGVIGTPPVPREEKRVKIQVNHIKGNGSYQSEMYDLPCTPEKLTALAQGLQMGAPFTEEQWAGKGKTFSTPKFRILRDEMIKHELAEYINPEEKRQGMQLTESGVALMQTYASLSDEDSDDNE